MRHLLAVAILAACNPPDPAAPDAPTSSDAPAALKPTVLMKKAVPSPDLDLLFVIDDSPSTADKQLAFTTAFPAILAQLDAIEGGRPNLHIGVASSDMGTHAANGTTGPTVGAGAGMCAGTGKAGDLQKNGSTVVTDAYISDARTGEKNYTGSLADAFSSIGRPGSAGCGFEQTLAGMRAALDGHNAGFERASANLGIIVLTDEDDCSLQAPGLLGPESAALGPLQSFRCTRFGVTCAEDITSVGTKTGCHPTAGSQFVEDIAPFRQFLLAHKPDPRQLMFAAVMGPADPFAVELRTPPGGGTAQTSLAHSCTYTGATGTQVADPGVRIKALADGLGTRSDVESVCNADLAPAATAIGKQLRRLVGDACLEQTIAMPASCELVETRGAAQVTLPACAGGAGDCFELVSDSACTDGAPLRLRITRSAPAAADAWDELRCAR